MSVSVKYSNISNKKIGISIKVMSLIPIEKKKIHYALLLNECQ